MRSLRETLGLGKGSLSALETPKSAAGFLPHSDEVKLSNLWIDIMKAEEGCRKLSREIQNYKTAVKEVQNNDEKFIRTIEESGVLAISPHLGQVVDEYLSVVKEVAPKTEEMASGIEQVMENPVKQYHGIYESLDAQRRKRDALVTELQRLQEKLDRLKLKGKRTTDTIVERDRALRQTKENNTQLLKEAECFHNLRVPFFRPSVKAYIQFQVDYYGSTAAQYNNHVRVSRGAHQMKDNEFEAMAGNHLKSIKGLSIVAA